VEERFLDTELLLEVYFWEKEERVKDQECWEEANRTLPRSGERIFCVCGEGGGRRVFVS